MSERAFWTYYISRNSANGVPSATIDMWCTHPKRVRRGNCIIWEPGDESGYHGHMNTYPAGFLRESEGIAEPDTDRELLVLERWAVEEKAQPKSEPKPRKKKMDYYK